MISTLKNPIVIVAIITQLGAMIALVMTFRHNSKVNGHKELVDNQRKMMSKLDEKREIADCKVFRKRIGSESDRHAESFRKVERALVFLVTKAGGKPQDLDLG